MINEDKTISYIKSKGPVLPVHIAKEQKINILFASAHLSDLAERKKVIISSIKIGGSPLYYLPGQEEKLQNFISNLNEKDRETFVQLKEKKVIRDDKTDPLTRVSLRSIKDFAISVAVSHNNKKYMFWKWYLMTNNEAEPLIQKLIDQDFEAERKQQQEKLKKESAEKEAIEEEKSRIEKERTRFEEEIKKMSEQRKEIEKLKEEHMKIIEEAQKKLEHQAEEKEIESKKKKKTIKLTDRKIIKPEEQTKFPEKLLQPEKEIPPAAEIPPEIQNQTGVFNPDSIKDAFFIELKYYFNEKNIAIIDASIIRKKAEIDLIISVPCPLGNISYYCKAKNKKSLTDADISSAVVRGQLKRLPAMLISKGELNKKAKELLNTEAGKNILIAKI